MTYICDDCEKYPCTDGDCKMRFTCPGFSQKVKPLTNADRYFRTATDREIAEFIVTHDVRTCSRHGWHLTEAVIDQAKEDWISWLQREAE